MSVESPPSGQSSEKSFAETALTLGGKSADEARRTGAIDTADDQVEALFAPQYQTVSVDVRILALETVTYRGALEPTRAQAAPPVAGPSIPTVMYVIPNCYMGNLPPRQNRLPSGCDVKQVQVLKPTVASR